MSQQSDVCVYENNDTKKHITPGIPSLGSTMGRKIIFSASTKLPMKFKCLTCWWYDKHTIFIFTDSTNISVDDENNLAAIVQLMGWRNWETRLSWSLAYENTALPFTPFSQPPNKETNRRCSNNSTD